MVKYKKNIVTDGFCRVADNKSRVADSPLCRIDYVLFETLFNASIRTINIVALGAERIIPLLRLPRPFGKLRDRRAGAAKDSSNDSV